LSATHYLKDNRLLPRGFDKNTAPERIAVGAPAKADPDFVGGSDTVAYSVALPAGASGPYTTNVEMLFQSIGFRWAQNLRNYDAPEPKRFVGYYTQAAAQSSKLIARAAAMGN
jgi:hypothetical protein